MDVKGVVISVEIDVQVAKNGGGTYPGSRLTYRDEGGAVKEKAFHQNVFKFNPSLKAQISNLANGQVFIMNMEKEGEFWNVKSIMPEGAVSAKPTNDTPPTGKAAAYQAPKSTYETAEERVIKQKYIIKQSSLGHALSFAKLTPEQGFSTDDIIEIAEKFSQYVYGESGNVAKKPLDPDFKGDEHEIY